MLAWLALTVCAFIWSAIEGEWLAAPIILAAILSWAVITSLLVIAACHIIGIVFGLEFGTLRELLLGVLSGTLIAPAVFAVSIFTVGGIGELLARIGLASIFPDALGYVLGYLLVAGIFVVALAIYVLLPGRFVELDATARVALMAMLVVVGMAVVRLAGMFL